MLEIKERTLRLIQSSIPEDVAIGFKFLVKENKPKTLDQLRRIVDDLKLNLKQDLDLYIGIFNIFIVYDNYNGGHKFGIRGRAYPAADDVKIIKL